MKQFNSLRRLTVLIIVLLGLLVKFAQAQVIEITVIDTIREKGCDYVHVSLNYQKLSTVKSVIEFKTYLKLLPEFMKGKFLYAKDIQIRDYVWSYDSVSKKYYWKPAGQVKSISWSDVSRYYYNE